MEKNWTIKDIENINEGVAADMAEEILNIKEHDVYLIDFKGYFGYSAVVFYNGYHIKYANDYQLHHAHKTKEELRTWYIETLNHKLYTEEEMETVTDYDDFKAKENFLRNYYSLRKTYISMFFIGDEKERTKRAKKTEKMFFDEISFAYYYDKDFVDHHRKLFNTLCNARDKKNEDIEYWIAAFKHEMYNHEYAINWEADTDVLSAFGNVPYKRGRWNLNDLMNEMGFNETQKTAYVLAKRKYYEENKEAM